MVQDHTVVNATFVYGFRVMTVTIIRQTFRDHYYADYLLLSNNISFVIIFLCRKPN